MPRSQVRSPRGRRGAACPSRKPVDFKPRRARTSVRRTSDDPALVVRRITAGRPGAPATYATSVTTPPSADALRELSAGEQLCRPAMVRRHLVPAVVDRDEIRDVGAEDVERADRPAAAGREVERLGRRALVRDDLSTCLGHRSRRACAPPRRRRSRPGCASPSRGRSPGASRYAPPRTSARRPPGP